MQQRDRVEIDNNSERARIIPFAQREMVDRFLYGIDPDHERAILRSVQQTLSEVSAGAQPLMRGLRRQRRDLLRKYLDDARHAVVRGLHDRTIRQLRDGSELDSLDAVSVMTKPDLANFAEALVNITSVKRRASLETETVGGPIDVAVISRDDGFIWVKRKHYFDKELNPRFFHRKYTQSSTPSEEDSK